MGSICRQDDVLEGGLAPYTADSADPFPTPQQGGGAEHSTFRHAFKLEAGAEEGTPRSTVYVRLLGPFAATCAPPLVCDCTFDCIHTSSCLRTVRWFQSRCMVNVLML